MAKLNPLVADRLVHESAHDLDVTRGTGKTTAKALFYLSKAINNPHVWISVEDHHDSYHSHRALVIRCKEIAESIGLRHFKFCASQPRIAFGRPE